METIGRRRIKGAVDVKIKCRKVLHEAWHKTMGAIDIGTNPSEPTSECRLGNRENPSEPTTPLPSPQYGKSKASKISETFCWLQFYDFSSGATRYEKSEHFKSTQITTYFTRLSLNNCCPILTFIRSSVLNRNKNYQYATKSGNIDYQWYKMLLNLNLIIEVD